MNFIAIIIICGIFCSIAYLILVNRFASRMREINAMVGQKIAEQEEAAKKREAQEEAAREMQPGAVLRDRETMESISKKDNVPYLNSVIEQIGCKLDRDEDGALSFNYQGELFHLEYNGLYLRIWDPTWASIDVSDPLFRNVLKAVNETNFNFGPTVVFTNLASAETYTLHTRYDIFFPAYANNDPMFLKMSLNMFFETKHQFATHIKSMQENGTGLPSPSALNPLVPSDN